MSFFWTRRYTWRERMRMRLHWRYWYCRAFALRDDLRHPVWTLRRKRFERRCWRDSERSQP